MCLDEGIYYTHAIIFHRSVLQIRKNVFFSHKIMVALICNRNLSQLNQFLLNVSVRFNNFEVSIVYCETKNSNWVLLLIFFFVK